MSVLPLPPMVRFYNAGRLRVLFLQIGDGRLQGRSLDILGDAGAVRKIHFTFVGVQFLGGEVRLLGLGV